MLASLCFVECARNNNNNGSNSNNKDEAAMFDISAQVTTGNLSQTKDAKEKQTNYQMAATVIAMKLQASMRLLSPE